METDERRRNGERGAVLAGLALGLIGLLAIASIAVDLGRVAFTATEVQTAAEVAATAGAKKLFQGGNDQGVKQAAVSVLDHNMIDRDRASTRNLTIQTGFVDPDGRFTPNNTRAGGLGSPNGVRATVTAEITNLMRGMFFNPTSRVRKTAVATFAPTGGCEDHPEIPLVIGDCTGFSDNCFSQSCLPRSIQVPSPSSAWTGFSNPPNRHFIESFLASGCGGGGATPPEVRIGDTISANNRLNDQ
jgi:hypothetical protein